MMPVCDRNGAIKWMPHDGGRKAAGFRGETGDCVCRAIAITTDLPYRQVYKRLADGNATEKKRGFILLEGGKTKPIFQPRSARNGISVHRAWFKRYMIELGFEWHGLLKIAQTGRTYLRDLKLPPGSHILKLRAHVIASVDGWLYDNQNPSRYKNDVVYGYWSLK